MSLASRRRMMLKSAKATEPEIDWSMSVIPQDPNFSIPEGWELEERFGVEQYPYVLYELFYSSVEMVFYSKYPFYVTKKSGDNRYYALFVSNQAISYATIGVNNKGTHQYSPSDGVTYIIDGLGYAKDSHLKGTREIRTNYPVIEVDSNGNKII